MSFRIYVTNDFDHMSRVAAGLIEKDIEGKQRDGRLPKNDDSPPAKGGYILGLATGNSPTGAYKQLAAAFNEGRLDPTGIRSFNLDEYVGLPGENAQQRCLHRESYSFFMIREFFGLLDRGFTETNVPWGTLIDQSELVRALEEGPDLYELQGLDKGKAVVIRPEAGGVLGHIRDAILAGYDRKIRAAGGVDLQVIGVGGRGHVAFHESGIPFEGNRMLLVQLDDNTLANAVADGHFPSLEECPRYAVSMGAELVYEAKTVLLLANGSRKTEPVAESVLGEPGCEVPISYGRRYVAAGGNLVYVLDEAAAAGLLARRQLVEAQGYELIDLREGAPVS